MLATILEEIKTTIPADIQAVVKTKSWREQQPADTFLDPGNLKFPVKYEGKYRCDLINAALVFSAIYSKKGSSLNDASYYKGIHVEAKKLSIKLDCSNDQVKLNEDETVSLSDIFEVYTLEAVQDMRTFIQAN